MDREYQPEPRTALMRPESSRPRFKSMHHQRQQPRSNARGRTPSRSGRSQHSRQDSDSAKASGGRDTDRHVAPRRQDMRAKSLSGRPNRVAARPTFLDDIKHEVMVNYLYQQQCSRLWVSDGTGELEGVVVRKSSDQYVACPRELSNSPFAQAMSALGVQVSAAVLARER